MRCDVCGTKIPIGSYECPQCGYKYEKSHVTTYDASKEHHNHIQVTYKDLQKKLNQDIQERVNKVSQRAMPNSRKSFMIFLISILCVVSAFSVSVLLLTRRYQESPQQDHLKFHQAVEQGLDENDTLLIAIDYEDNLVDFMENTLQLKDVYAYETLWGEDPLEAYLSVDGYLNEGCYTFNADFSNGEVSNETIIIENYDEQGIHQSKEMRLEKELLDDIGIYYYNDTQLYDKVKDSFHNIKEVADGKWESYVNDEYSIYFVEELEEDGYRYYCKIKLHE
jgi:hypothetical protein